MITKTTKKARTLAGVSKYSGTWGKEQVIHLLRRTLFGATMADVNYFLSKSLDTTVDELLTITQPANPPLNHYNDRSPDPDVALGQTWVNAPRNPQLNGQRLQSFKLWWAGTIATQDRTITEKLTLFWHNHFATETSIVRDAFMVYEHNDMLRTNALGNFKDLVKKVTIDPAMLIYLNGYLNTRRAPDENYARELQELFTLGKGDDSQYTEADVQAAARVLTGWRIDRSTFKAYFDPNQHDSDNKTFSTFYSDTTLTGKTGAQGAEEVDDLLTMIFAKDTVIAEHICRKLYRWFVYYEIDATAETNVIQPLAQEFIANDWNIKPVLKMLFSSEHFFDSVNMGAIIKSPIDFTTGLIRQMEVELPDGSNVPQTYNVYSLFYGAAAQQQQELGDPPSVAGWPAYYQIPQYHELWINSDTLPKRSQIGDLLVVTGLSTRGYKLVIDTIALAESMSDPSDPDILLDDLLFLSHTLGISSDQRDYLISVLRAGQTTNSAWTDAWNDYKNDPTNTTKKNVVSFRLITVVKFIMNLAEFQLS